MASISFDKVQKAYGTTKVIHGVGFDIHDGEFMAFSLKLRKADASVIAERVAKASKILNLDTYLERFPRELSGGQRQRVAMGRAIVRDPKVFLFDEPLSNLDAKLRVAMRAEIKALHQRLKTTTVYVTHERRFGMSKVFCGTQRKADRCTQ